jgi:hypothetical protein
MKRSPRPRETPANLSESVHYQLNMYALAASAAGVSLLGLAQPAEAKIVYRHAHITISPYALHSYALDLNHDGKTDFVIQSTWTETGDSSAGTQHLLASAVKCNGVAAAYGGAAAMKAGQQIGPHKNFTGRVMASDQWSAGASTSVKRGNWVNVSNRYLGLKFKIKGKIHYGWARLSVRAQTRQFYLLTTLTGYAYETIPNKPIIAGKTEGPDDSGVEQPNPASLAAPIPEPATLGLLALGAPELTIWRREESVGTMQ